MKDQYGKEKIPESLIGLQGFFIYFTVITLKKLSIIISLVYCASIDLRYW